MSGERKPLWPWIVALLTGLPVLYVASIGPVCWTLSRMSADTPGIVNLLYTPVLRVWHDGPATARDALWWYCNFGGTCTVEVTNAPGWRVDDFRRSNGRVKQLTRGAQKVFHEP